MTRYTFSLIALLSLGMTAQIRAQPSFMPTPDQIAQFKSLSPAEQKSLAESAGIDLKSLNLGGATNDQPNLSESTPASNPTTSQAKTERTNQDKKKSTLQNDNDLLNRGNLSLFGRDLFENDLEAFRPASNMPIPADYVMGPGDTIVLQLYGKESANYSLTVNREGQIQFPKIGPVTLAGLNFSQTQKLIDDIVEQQMIGVKASVTMGALRSIRVFVLGEVLRPGSFAVGALSTMTNGLFLSGGISEVGSLRNVQLKRNGKVAHTLDLYDLLLKGDTSNDARLLPGDVIFVPPIGKTVIIDGEIKRPAMYEIESTAKIEDLIALAGGLKNTAYLPLSYLIRHDPFGEKMLFNVDLSKQVGLTRTLEDGDILSVASKLDFVNNQVIVVGHVKRAGARSWRPGMRFTDLAPTPRDMLPNPDIEIAIIQRFSSETRRVEVILFSPKAAWQSPSSAADPLLLGSDEIRIFNYDDDRSAQLSSLIEQLESQARFNELQKVVAISGSVRFPGTYPLTDGMSTQDLINLAGGLTESALNTNGEITRYDINEQRERMVSHISVDIADEPVVLRPGDTLQVKQIPLWKSKETVQISGEVMFPGTYSILPGETLSNVLERAGGVTEHAYPLGAIFSRKELRELEQQRITELKGSLQNEIVATNAAGDVTGREGVEDKDVELLMKTLDTIKPLGRMVINLPMILKSPENHDFRLEDGDTLVIPRYKPSVTVVGEVQYPTSHFYDSALDAVAYIDHSGGYKKHADERRVYIVRADGSVSQPQTSAWFRADRDTIRPGDTIVVPLETDQIDKLSVWAKVTTIIYQAALGAAAVKSL
jgi:polysaccharide biosynthesis/export protein